MEYNGKDIAKLGKAKTEKIGVDGLRFVEASHEYFLNGIRIPSVTQIMKPLTNQIYGTINEEVLNNAAARGTKVHSAIETYASFGMKDIEPDLSGYFDGFLRWMEDCNVSPVLTETAIAHGFLPYAGTFDMTAISKGKYTLIDFKTSSKFERMLYGVQLEAYKQAMETRGMKVPEARAIVMLKKDGTYELHEDLPPDNECWNAFQACLTINSFSNKYR